MEHLSVLKKETIDFLDLERGNVVVDATLGLGGHAKLILEKIGFEGKIIAFEQDERNLVEAKKRLAEFQTQIVYIHDNFRYLKNRVIGAGFESVDAILFDLGLSSPHVDDEQRGFSFSKTGPLDMRFDRREIKTAYDVVNFYSESDLVKIFSEYGQERYSKRIARQICERRKVALFETTTELADFIESVVPKKWPKKNAKKTAKSHPATQVFQAIRIEVNEEIEVLKEALAGAFDVLGEGGRIVVMSYHSLEDTVVKRFFQNLMKPDVNPDEAMYKTYGDPKVEKLTKKPIIPENSEIELNPRSRSAKLRAYKKL